LGSPEADELSRNPRKEFLWRGSWRSTYLNLSTSHLPRVDCSFLFSDGLHRPFLCSQISLDPFTKGIPPHNQIPRLGDLTLAEFNTSWTNRPFILTDPVKLWLVYQEWNEEVLLSKYKDVIFRAEAVDWPLKAYFEYMNNNIDESPLYLFDRDFVNRMGLVVSDGDGENEAYCPPDCFVEDLFTLFGDERPDYRWLIIGPERSGSTFHKDPNATSAWNAVIRGSKYWIMFPSSASLPPPPGVFVSDDQSEVTTPLSIAEWLLTFHGQARNSPGCLEGVCYEGEVLHVPSCWWHLVVNLETTIAITQNFVPKAHLSSAINFLKNKSNQVSGFRSDVQDPYSLFMERLDKRFPELLKKQEKMSNKRKWEKVVYFNDEDGSRDGIFSFGFKDDIDDEV